MPHNLNGFIRNTNVAYFTMEIALRNEMHTYSGGLGVLAGDMARSCADLKIPVVFVSLLSRDGYLRQEINQEGQQVGDVDPWDPGDWAKPLSAMVALELEGRSVWIRPWLHVLTCPLGHTIPVILLDTDLEENASPDRYITDRLYGGDEVYRLKQEAVLGIGGVRILQALGFEIRKYHLNEGHAALLSVELLRRYSRASERPEAGASMYDGGHVRERCIFTTHTPIDAGHDQFPYSIVERVLGDFIELKELQHYAGVDRCNMTRLALNLSGYVNGVAPRHAETTRSMFPGYEVQEISNGIHTGSWAHRAFARLYDANFPRWSHEPEALMHADQLDDASIWQAHREAKTELLALLKEKTGIAMELDIPLIGFARRMTGYKRPELLFADIERLRAVAKRHPFQVVWAGKAHPHDDEGARLIEHINRHIRELAQEIKMTFVPNYDLSAARYLVSGSDVWLNTPLPPLEASGTSGMKAAVNGGLNLSVLDGWWLEAWLEDVTGWSIGDAAPGGAEHQASSLYDKLEHKVLPLYYQDRSRWIWMMKQSISKIACYFSSQRMMRRYAAEAYLH
jgi:glycogen phosphorylase